MKIDSKKQVLERVLEFQEFGGYVFQAKYVPLKIGRFSPKIINFFQKTLVFLGLFKIEEPIIEIQDMDSKHEYIQLFRDKNDKFLFRGYHTSMPDRKKLTVTTTDRMLQYNDLEVTFDKLYS